MSSRSWTAAEVAILRAQYGVVRHDQMKSLDRSAQAIMWKANALGLKSNRNKLRVTAWTNDQENWLRDFYGRVSIKEIAKALRKSSYAVSTRAYMMGLSSPVGYANSEKVVEIPYDVVKRYESGEDVEPLHKLLGISPYLFLKALRRQGVHIRTASETGRKNIDKLKTVADKMRADGSLSVLQSAGHQKISVAQWHGYKKSDAIRKQHNLSLTPEWRAWRRAVYARDRHICVMCRIPRHKNRYVKYDPHHIVRKALRPDLMYVVDNGVTLCRSCHRQTFRQEEIYAPRFVAYIAALRASGVGNHA